jgi:hypothetical protein
MSTPATPADLAMKCRECLTVTEPFQILPWIPEGVITGRYRCVPCERAWSQQWYDDDVWDHEPIAPDSGPFTMSGGTSGGTSGQMSGPDTGPDTGGDVA